MKFYLYILLFSSLLPVFSQDRGEVWTKLSISKVVHSKWSMGVDLQYRGQANYYIPNNHNIFETNLATSIRLWAYYKLAKDWKVTAAPIAYFYNTEIMTDFVEVSHYQEMRTMWGISKNWQISRLKNKNRLMYEARFINWNTSKSITQHRYRIQNVGMVPIQKIHADGKLYLYLMNEYMLKTQQGKTNFDQNRSFLALQLQYKNIELTSGYQFIRQKGNKSDFNKHIWLTSLNFEFL